MLSFSFSPEFPRKDIQSRSQNPPSGRATSRLLALGCAALCLGILATAASAEDWSQFRGPDRDGQASMLKVPDAWPEAPTKLWSMEVGEGQASPVVSNGVIYLMARQGDDEVAMAMDVESGKTLWTKNFPTPYKEHQAAMKFGKGPRTTPVVAEGVACFVGVDARMTCHDIADGKVLWTKDFSEQSDIAETFCGASLTPLIENGVVYSHLGDDRAGRLFAADLRTGKEKWSWDGEGPGYASPLMLEIDGVRQLVTFATVHLLSFDPETGEKLWQREYLDKWRENIPTPLVVGKRIVISDYVNGALSLWPKKTDKGWVVEDQWHNAELTQRMASPVTDGERIYGFSNRRKGQYFAQDPATGKVLWQDEGRGGQNSVLTMAGEWLLAVSTASELKVGRWHDDALVWEKTYSVADSPIWAQPAWLEDGMLIKDAKHLTRFTLQAESGKNKPAAGLKNGPETGSETSGEAR